jgi:hypothetical protein
LRNWLALLACGFAIALPPEASRIVAINGEGVQ